MPISGGLTLDEGEWVVAGNLAVSVSIWARKQGVLVDSEAAKVLRQMAYRGESLEELKKTAFGTRTKCPGCRCDSGCPNNQKCGVKCWEIGDRRECAS